MNTTLTIKTPKKLRDDAKLTALRMGIPLTTVVNTMLRQFVFEQRLVIEAECPYPSHTPNAETRKALEEFRNPSTRANLKRYSSAEKMFTDILGKNWRARKKGTATILSPFMCSNNIHLIIKGTATIVWTGVKEV